MYLLVLNFHLLLEQGMNNESQEHVFNELVLTFGPKSEAMQKSSLID